MNKNISGIPIITILWRSRRLDCGEKLADLIVGVLVGQPAHVVWLIGSRRSIRGQVRVALGRVTTLPAVDVMRSK